MLWIICENNVVAVNVGGGKESSFLHFSTFWFSLFTVFKHKGAIRKEMERSAIKYARDLEHDFCTRVMMGVAKR